MPFYFLSILVTNSIEVGFHAFWLNSLDISYNSLHSIYHFFSESDIEVFRRTISITLYATPGKSRSSKSSKTTPCSRNRRKLSNEWNDNGATCGRPHRSAPSSTSSSYFIQRAVSFHSSILPCSSSNWTNISCGLWSNCFFGDCSSVGCVFNNFSLACEWMRCRRSARGSSERCDIKSSMWDSCVAKARGKREQKQSKWFVCTDSSIACTIRACLLFLFPNSCSWTNHSKGEVQIQIFISFADDNILMRVLGCEKWISHFH